VPIGGFGIKRRILNSRSSQLVILVLKKSQDAVRC
jgi:hypothetical protein